jgi:hypothetical protein
MWHCGMLVSNFSMQCPLGGQDKGPTYVRPKLISPHIIIFFFSGMWTFQITRSGINEQSKSVRSEYAVQVSFGLSITLAGNDTPT